MHFLPRFLRLEGRASRLEFWIFQIVIVVVLLAYFVAGASAIYAMLQAVRFEAISTQKQAIGEEVLGWVLGYFVLAAIMLWPTVAVIVRRLHDRGKPGWWAIAFYTPQMLYIAGFVLLGFEATLQTPMLPLFNLVVVVWYFVELGCFRGSTGTNAYDPDPADIVRRAFDEVAVGTAGAQAFALAGAGDAMPAAQPTGRVVMRDRGATRLPQRARPAGFGRRGA